MHSSKAFLLILVESMNYPQGTFLYCVPHCNRTVHNWFQVHKHTLVHIQSVNVESRVALSKAPERAVTVLTAVSLLSLL